METNEKIELDELREQVALLKYKLQHQKIVSERAISEAAQKGIGKLNTAGTISMVFGVFAVVFCTIAFHQMGFSTAFVIGTAIFLGVCAIATIYTHCSLRPIDVAHGNLVEIMQKLIRFRKIYSYWHFYSIPALLVWCFFLYYDALQLGMDTMPFLIGGGVGGVLGAAMGLKRYFAIMRETDSIIAKINELMQNE